MEPLDVHVDLELGLLARTRLTVEPSQERFATVAQGKATPADAVSNFDQQARRLHRKWHNQGLV